MASDPCSPPHVSDFKPWTEVERQDSLDAALSHWQPGRDLWVFAYGSLIWRPEFDFAERRLATLRGHHRSLCLWSRVNRGTPEIPGLVFGLDRGGSCRGMTYRIASSDIPVTFKTLWAREMSTGAYHPRWLGCDTEDGPVSALAFIIKRESSGYVSALPEDELVRIILRASGKYGPCIDYVMQTADALKAVGIQDERLARLASLLESTSGQAGTCR